MNTDHKIRTRLLTTTIIFWLLLAYIVAALVWWFMSLEKQNAQLRDEKINLLNTAHQDDKNSVIYQAEYAEITKSYNRGKIKYIGEGAVFLGLILLSAVYIIRSIRKQIKMQQQQQNFMMAVTHELKTPIAVSKLNLETLLKHRLDEQKQHKLITMTLDETIRLNFLTNNILVSSQLEATGHKINKEELNFSSLVKERAREFRNRFPARSFVEHIGDDAEVKGDPLLLQILINNLIENAIKYSDKNSTISVSLQATDKGKIVLQIIDEGPGVPREEKEKIFSKFYRIGNEATRTKQGSGLGLYLCKQIAIDHNADITVTDNEPRGSKFVVVFK